MPTYQYLCTACGHAFEQVQSFSDDALTVCPECTGRLRKVFNSVGVVFKGSGFYKTDSRSTTSATAPAAASADSSGSSSSSSPAAASSSSGSSGSSDAGSSSSTKPSSSSSSGAAASPA